MISGDSQGEEHGEQGRVEHRILRAQFQHGRLGLQQARRLLPHREVEAEAERGAARREQDQVRTKPMLGRR